jgi:hypothetical protein
VKVKFGIKALSLVSSLALAFVFVSGCTEETPSDAAKPAGGAMAPASKPAGGDMKPATPPATPGKPESKP